MARKSSDARSSIVSIPEEEPLLKGFGPPPDKWNLGYLIFFLQGVGLLFPWNAFITVTGYFDSKLSGSTFSANFENYITLASQVGSITFFAVATRYQHRFMLGSRVYYPLLTFLAAFSVNAGLVKASKLSQNAFFGITLIIVFITAAVGAFLQGGIFGLAGRFPPRYVQALMTGVGLGGVIIAVVNVITLLSMNNVDDAAMLFFIISLAVVSFCIVTFYYAFRLPFFEYYLSEHPDPPSVQHRLNDPTTTQGSPTPSESSTDGSPKKKNLSKHRSYLQTSDTLAATFGKIRYFAFCVFGIFFVTLALFPSVTASVSMHGNSKYATTYFIPVYCFVGFNLFDFIGRWLTGVVQFPSLGSAYLMKYIVFIRLAFFPLFFLLPLDLNGENNHMPTEFTGYAWPYVFMMLLGLTNGYFGSICMILGPSRVRREEQEAAGAMMAFAMVLGIGSGILFSFPVKAIICHCNPFESHNTTSSHISNSTNASFLHAYSYQQGLFELPPY